VDPATSGPAAPTSALEAPRVDAVPLSTGLAMNVCVPAADAGTASGNDAGAVAARRKRCRRRRERRGPARRHRIAQSMRRGVQPLLSLFVTPKPTPSLSSAMYRLLRR